MPPVPIRERTDRPQGSEPARVSVVRDRQCQDSLSFYSQNMTVAASTMVERESFGRLS